VVWAIVPATFTLSITSTVICGLYRLCLLLLLVILVGEIFPKAVGISFPERGVRINSLPLRGWFHFLGPVRRVLEIDGLYHEDETDQSQR